MSDKSDKDSAASDSVECFYSYWGRGFRFQAYGMELKPATPHTANNLRNNRDPTMLRLDKHDRWQTKQNSALLTPLCWILLL